MYKLIKTIVDRSRGPLSYLSDLTTVALILYSIFLSAITFINNPLTSDLQNKLQGMNLLIKFLLSFSLFFMLFYVINRTYKKLKFIFEVNQLSSNLEKERINQTTGQLIKNYKNIVPSTVIVREIFEEFEARAKKWSPDSYLAGLDLDIWVKKNQISMEVKSEFFSKKKEASIKFGTIGMKVPRKYSITPDQISYDTYRVRMMPIFLEREWRKFVVEGLERIENEIAGHEFYLSIGTGVGVVQFYLDPGFIPHKSFTFYLKRGGMYKDILCKEKVASL